MTDSDRIKIKVDLRRNRAFIIPEPIRPHLWRCFWLPKVRWDPLGWTIRLHRVEDA